MDFTNKIPDWKNIAVYEVYTTNNEASRIYGYMYILISRVNSFITSLHCHELLMWMQIPGVLCLRHAVVFLCDLPRKLLGPILWFQVCVSDNTVDISDVPCTGEVVSLSPRKLETVLFWNASSQKALIIKLF